MRLLTTSTLLMLCLPAIGQTLVDPPSKYTGSGGEGVIIQNSLPKGGGRYTDPTGRDFVYIVFWSRVINETANPLEMTVSFPADSFGILPLSDSYLKVFLPSDTMTLEKLPLFDYGLTDIESFLNTNFNKPTTLQRTIDAKGEGLFYTLVLLHQTGGPVRTELVLKEQNLFYRINLLDFALLPCGKIVFKK